MFPVARFEIHYTWKGINIKHVVWSHMNVLLPETLNTAVVLLKGGGVVVVLVLRHPGDFVNHMKPEPRPM